MYDDRTKTRLKRLKIILLERRPVVLDAVRVCVRIPYPFGTIMCSLNFSSSVSTDVQNPYEPTSGPVFKSKTTREITVFGYIFSSLHSTA